MTRHSIKKYIGFLVKKNIGFILLSLCIGCEQ